MNIDINAVEIRQITKEAMNRINNDIVLSGGSPFPEGAKAYRMESCMVVIWQEADLWHMSVSAFGRDPQWIEMIVARYRLLPAEVNMVMSLPPLQVYKDNPTNTFTMVEFKATERKRVWLPFSKH